MSKKCKSQTRMQKKRPLGEEESVKADTDRLTDLISNYLEIPEAPIEEEGRISINILADANNFISTGIIRNM